MGAARLAAEYMDTVEMIQKSFKDMKFPIIVIHSLQDDTVDPEGSRQLYEFSQVWCSLYACLFFFYIHKHHKTRLYPGHMSFQVPLCVRSTNDEGEVE